MQSFHFCNGISLWCFLGITFEYLWSILSGIDTAEMGLHCNQTTLFLFIKKYTSLSDAYIWYSKCSEW